MKALFSFVLILFVGFSALAQQGPEFKFESETVNYGKIAFKSNGVRVFEFTNVGKAPLVISSIKASCGCTIPKVPKDPILPGEKGKIEVSYDTSRVGGFSKIITVFSNAKTERKILKIKGFVEKAEASQK